MNIFGCNENVFFFFLLIYHCCFIIVHFIYILQKLYYNIYFVRKIFGCI